MSEQLQVKDRQFITLTFTFTSFTPKASRYHHSDQQLNTSIGYIA